MIKKTYQASTLSEAIAQIKDEMGPKASITSTRRVAASRGFLKKIPAHVEVDVSVEERHLTQEQLEKFSSSEKFSSKQNSSSLVSTDFFTRLFRTKTKINAPVKAAHSGASPKDDVTINLSPMAQQRILLQKLEALDAENKKLKESLSHQGIATAKAVDSVFKSTGIEWIDQLFDQQKVSSQFILKWVDHFQSKLPQNSNQDEVLESLIDFLSDGVKVFNDPMPKVMAFIGPSGSGKSSMVMKLAYDLKKHHKKKVAIFTLDGQVGETEPAKVFAEQNQIPYCVVHQIRTYKNLIKEYKDYDHILIDCYAVSPRDEEKKSGLKKRLEQMEATSFLVLDANDGDLSEKYHHYSVFDPWSVMLSKLDEVDTVGRIFSFACEDGVSLAYFGVGRKSESDLEKVSSERLCALFLPLDDLLTTETTQKEVVQKVEAANSAGVSSAKLKPEDVFKPLTFG